jgi:hypothetical protein
MEQRWQGTSKWIYICLWKGVENHELGTCFLFVCIIQSYQRGCDMLKLSHFLVKGLKDDDEVVSLPACLLHLPQKDSWLSFLLETESNQGI